MSDKVSPYWHDVLRLDLQLSEQEKLFLEKARDYAQQTLAPRILDSHRNESFDRSIFAEFGTQGFLGLNIKGYECTGLNHVCYGLLARELERVDGAYRTMVGVHASLAMQAIYLHGSEEQKKHYLPAMAKGGLIGCFGLTEPNHGSDIGSMETTAKKAKGGYVLNGHKKWIGLAAVADVLIIWAKDDEQVVRGFITEKSFEGLTTDFIRGKFSLRAAPTCEIRLNNVFVPEGCLLPATRGMSSVFQCLNKSRFGIAWGTLGAAEDCWQVARDYVMDREQFGVPLASKQLIQKKLADMQTEIATGTQAALRVARLLDEGHCPFEAINLIKRNNAKKALEVALTAREMLGANGILDENRTIRHVMNLLADNTYEGTEDVNALILGRSQTGINAF